MSRAIRAFVFDDQDSEKIRRFGHFMCVASSFRKRDAAERPAASFNLESALQLAGENIDDFEAQGFRPARIRAFRNTRPPTPSSRN